MSFQSKLSQLGRSLVLSRVVSIDGTLNTLKRFSTTAKYELPEQRSLLMLLSHFSGEDLAKNPRSFASDSKFRDAHDLFSKLASSRTVELSQNLCQKIATTAVSDLDWNLSESVISYMLRENMQVSATTLVSTFAGLFATSELSSILGLLRIVVSTQKLDIFHDITFTKVVSVV